MVNTLRITSIVAVVVAGLVLLVVVGPQGVVPNVLAGFALRSDEDTQRILGEPGAVEQWRTKHGSTKAVDKNATSVLVQQAELLKDFLVPKVPVKLPEDKDDRRGRNTVITPPPVNTAKFNLVGTSYEPANPKGSFAYIFIAGDNTYQWVQVGDEIGHYTVKEVRPDAMICFDGKGDVEMKVQDTIATSSMLEDDDATASAAGQTEVMAPPMPSAVGHMDSPRITGRPASEPWKRAVSPAEPGPEALRGRTETDRRARELVERMRESGSRLDDRAAYARQLIKEFQSSQVGPNEARKIEDLGRELNKSN